jgi:signal transduction histidine kinase
LNEKLNEDEHSALKSLEDSVRRIDNMIDDLLSFATLGAGEKVMAQVNLNEVVALVQADLQLRIKENQANIVVSNLPTIDAHKGMMVQLFQNLINNALKFRKENENPVVEISWNQQDNWHEILVKDNGVGIAEKHQKDVFKLFKRLDKTKNIEGTGIGLSLCQKIITKMQGTIGLASVEGEGTTFIIKLPIT